MALAPVPVLPAQDDQAGSALWWQRGLNPLLLGDRSVPWCHTGDFEHQPRRPIVNAPQRGFACLQPRESTKAKNRELLEGDLKSSEDAF